MSAVPREICRVGPPASNVEDEWQRLQRSLRQSEKRSRARRVEKIRTMRGQLETLSRVQCVLPLVGDVDAVWDAFLDEDLKRTRDTVRRLLPGSQTIQRLLHERALLCRLLEEHTLMVRSIRAVTEAHGVGALSVGDWKSSVQRWRALARIHFRPWTIGQCEREIEAATDEMNRFNRSNDKQSTGASFLGWQDSRRIDRKASRIQFQFRKTFRGFDVMDYVNIAWDAYRNAATYEDVIIGPHASGAHDVLQEIGPDMMIVRGAERYEALQVDAHIVYLVFRVKTDRGFTQCVRSICCPEIMAKINSPKDVWPSNFIWLEWESLKDGVDSGYKLRIGGSMGDIGIQYATRWMVDALGCVLRSEHLATRRQLLTHS